MVHGGVTSGAVISGSCVVAGGVEEAGASGAGVLVVDSGAVPCPIVPASTFAAGSGGAVEAPCPVGALGWPVSPSTKVLQGRDGAMGAAAVGASVGAGWTALRAGIGMAAAMVVVLLRNFFCPGSTRAGSGTSSIELDDPLSRALFRGMRSGTSSSSSSFSFSSSSLSTSSSHIGVMAGF